MYTMYSMSQITVILFNAVFFLMHIEYKHQNIPSLHTVNSNDGRFLRTTHGLDASNYTCTAVSKNNAYGTLKGMYNYVQIDKLICYNFALTL